MSQIKETVDRGVILLISIIMITLAVYFIISFFSPTLIELSNNPVVNSGDLVVKGNVYLAYSNVHILWIPGTYSNCYVNLTSSSCPYTGTVSQSAASIYAPFVVGLEMVMVVGLILLVLRFLFIRRENL